MKFFILLIFSILIFNGIVWSQTTVNSSNRIEAYDGQYFMPNSKGFVQENLQVAADLNKTNPSQVNILKRKLEKCAALFRNYPIMNSPKGIKVNLTSEIFAPDGFNQVKWIPFRYGIGLYTTTACDTIPCWDETTDAWVSLHFNNPAKLLGSPVINDIYTEPRLTGSFFGKAEYDRIMVPNRTVVVKNNEIPLFEPVTREDFVLTLINYFQSSIEKGEKQKAASTSQKDLPAKPATKSAEELQFDSFYNDIKKIDPQLAEKLKQTYIEAGILQLPKSTPTETPTVDKIIVLNTWREAVRKLKAELNAMNPMERRTQAWWSNTEESNVSGLTQGSQRGSLPLIRLSKNLIDKTKPSTNIQLIVIEWSMPPGTEIVDTSGYNLAYSKLSKLSLDEKLWRQVFELIDP